MARAISSKRKWQTLIAVPFLALFVAVGVYASAITLVGPFLASRAAQSWPEVPCRVLESEVVEHSDSDGSTYSVRVRYEYQVAGRSHVSDRYSFFEGSSSGRSGKQEIVDGLPRGSACVARVDPEDPSSAVLEHRFTSDFWFLLLLPLGFILLPLVAMIGVVRSGRAPIAKVGGLPAAPAGVTRGPVLLSPRSSTKHLLGLIVFLVVWNTGVLVAFMAMLEDEMSWSAFMPLALFGLVGVVLLGVAMKQLVKLAAPRFEARLDRAPAPGETVTLSWSLAGKQQPDNLELVLVAREKATYTRGTDTVTDEHVFLEKRLLRLEPVPARSGQLELTVPAGAMHSFASAHNAVEWSLKARAAIPLRPDVDEELLIPVGPGECPSATRQAAVATRADEGPVRLLLPDGDRYAPGDTVRGTLEWELSEAPERFEQAHLAHARQGHRGHPGGAGGPGRGREHVRRT